MAVPTKQPTDLTSDEFIYWLFKNRCIVCRKPASEINHIEPRSRGRGNISDWRNKVPMCQEHHNEYHKNGTDQDAIDSLKAIRAEYLLSINRQMYI